MKRPVEQHIVFIILPLFLTWLFVGCTEEFTPDIPPSDSILVVEALITNELKNQEIYLSRSLDGDKLPKIESNAVVRVLDSSNGSFVFEETEPGKYVSVVAFAATSGQSYSLTISLADGRSYSSTPVELPQTSQIDRVYAEPTTTDTGTDGVTIKADSFDPTGNSNFYRYEYEETYKIIAPNWNRSELVVSSVELETVALVDRENEEQTCYASVKSNTIILTETTRAGEDRVSGLEVRFLNKKDYIISNRYSILVKQFVLSSEVHAFYEKLKDFSGLENLFSQSQPGFISGNIFSDDDDNEKVVGVFDISTVSEKRLFFNYSDFYPNEELPPFLDDCGRIEFLGGRLPNIFDFVNSKSVSYVGDILGESLGLPIGYIVVPRICGDCTVLGSATVPEFWEE